ncbi:kyphoscoliosis peptidase-like [Eublepharis macularius]|uniref:Kyphoscoliosis peptidase-like n=1 Tax=Eublepharis macularius TaxID=481883 RepID=A0AA97KX30_EUBMA|nr:kyphoscoliosis peptidase-like [Eublepharis macularius]
MFPTAQAEEGNVQATVRQPRSTVAQAEEGNVQATVRQPRSTVVTSETRYYGHQSATASELERGNCITLEIHPRQTTSQIGKESSFNKGIRVFHNLRGHDNEGFQDEGDQGPSLPPSQDLHDYGEERLSLPNKQDLYGGQEDLSAYPWDKSSLKSMPLDLQQFKKLDAYASKVSVTRSVEDLVRVLLQETYSDLEKIRAIWIWTCHHIEYDVKGYHDKANRSCEPTDVLRSGKSVCAGYAGLFEQMCSIAGIQCKKLSGYSKGYAYKPGHVFEGEPDHAWNAVFLHGRWHLLDSTWGSGIVDDSCTKFTFRYDEFYFLTHPALFIADHFPEDHEWQLLKPRLTLQQFECSIRCRPAFYSEGLIAATPATTVIHTENGKATIFVETHSPALFLFKLNEAKENCLLTLQRNGMKLEVYPHQTGTHCLQIYAKHFHDKKENYSLVLEYSLKCSAVDKSISLPRDLIQPVGPSWLTEQAGILKALPPAPVIHTEDGRCVVTFIRTKDLDFFATLKSDNSRLPENTMRRHIWKTCRGNQAELKIHLPHAGHFALLIWAKKASDPGHHQCALSYLISCPNKSVMWPVFPQSYTNWEDDYELLAPLAGNLPANCQVQFKLKLPGVFKASVECGGKTLSLTLSETGFWEGACNTSGGTTVTVRISKDANNSFWSLLEYEVETH